ncbi:MAG: TIGR02466 family protein [Alphaproteobacteria bacterium]
MTLNVQLQNGVVLGFPTPMVRHPVAEAETINGALKAAILKRARKTEGTQRHNVGVWRSEDDFLSWPVAEIEVLKQAINRAVAQLTQLSMGASGKMVRGEMNAVAWANVCRAGGYVKPHTHPLSTWSGAYVVAGEKEVEGHPDSGVLELLDPRPGVDLLNTPGDPYGGSFKVQPIPGLLVVHPSWLVHFVNPYFGRAELITVGFTVFVKGVSLVDKEDAAQAAE